jgi:hypothetical protein
VLERVDWTQFTGSNQISMLKIYLNIILAEKKAEVQRPSDAKTLQPDTTQQPDAPIPDESLPNLVEETESAISSEPQGDRDSVKLNNDQKAAEAAQSADPKAATQETATKETDKGILAGYIDELFDEMASKELGQGQNEEKAPHCPEPTTVQ